MIEKIKQKVQNFVTLKVFSLKTTYTIRKETDLRFKIKIDQN